METACGIPVSIRLVPYCCHYDSFAFYLRCLLFRFAPTSRRAKLQPLTEGFAGLADLAILGALIVTFGVSS